MALSGPAFNMAIEKCIEGKEAQQTFKTNFIRVKQEIEKKTPPPPSTKLKDKKEDDMKEIMQKIVKGLDFYKNLNGKPMNIKSTRLMISMTKMYLGKS